MERRFFRRVSPAASWSATLASFSAVLFVVAGLGHRFGLVDTLPFFWLLGLVGFLAIAALCLSAKGFADLWNAGDKGGRRSLAGALLALFVAVPFLIGAWRGLTHPALTDVSTDAFDPPVFRLAEADRQDPLRPIPSISREQAREMAEHYPTVNGRRYATPTIRVFEEVRALVASRGWRVLGVDGIAGRDVETTLEAVAGSFVFAFPADVAIRLTDEGETCFVDMRSVSRFAAHDLGDNAARIVRFLGDLDKAVATNTGTTSEETVPVPIPRDQAVE